MDSNRNSVTDWVASAPQSASDPVRQPRARSWASLAIVMIAIVAALLVVALIAQAGRPTAATADPTSWTILRVLA